MTKTKMKKKNKQIISYSVGIAILIGIVSLGVFSGNSNDNNNSNNVLSYSASALTVVENNFDFGMVPMNGGNVSHEFAIRNDGVESVVVQKVYTSCGCTTAVLANAMGRKYGEFGMPGHGLSSDTQVEVVSGETIVVEAIFDPAAHGPSGIGLAQRSVYIETNSAKSPKLELSFQAIVTP